MPSKAPAKRAAPNTTVKGSRLKDMSVGRRDVRTLRLADCEIIEGFNPRDSIPESRIREMMGQLKAAAGDDKESNGQKEPARGRVMPSGKFGFTTGNTRYLALGRLAQDEARFGVIHVIAEPPGYTDLEREIDHLTSNDGAPLQMHEQGKVYKRLRDDHKLTVKQIHQRHRKTEQHIYDCLALVDAAPEVLKAITDGKIAASTVVTIIRDEKPDLVPSVVKTAIATATLAGKSKATSKHVTKGHTRTKKPGGKKKSSKGGGKSDIEAAADDLTKRERDERMARATEHQADSVGRLQDLLNATVPSKCVTDRRQTVEWMIDYLKGTKELPAAIAFLMDEQPDLI